MTEWVSGNIFIRPNRHMRKGDVIQGHTHNFDHTSFVVKGAVHVKKTAPDGTVTEADFGEDHRAPHFFVEADHTHEITAIEDYTSFYCIYSHRTPQGKVVQYYTGWHDAYV